jgi:N-acetylglucosamine-6-phosphate deacetylase
MKQDPFDIIANGRVLLPDGETAAVDLRIQQGLIVEIAPRLKGKKTLDAAGDYVLPGFVDLHCHGMGFCSLEKGSLAEWAALEAQQGATRFFPTLFGPPENLIELMQQHLRETDQLKATPQVGGFRLESPYLAQTGAGRGEDLAPILPELTDRLLIAGGGHIRIWDLSPELPGAVETIARLSGQGVVCSLAHTRATIEQARAAVDAGLRLVTHLFDTFAVPEMIDPGVYPAGLVDYLLVEDRVTCEIIADGTHVHPLLVEKALRCKGPKGVAFVTDSNYGAGLPPGDYRLPAGWGEARIRDRNNGVRLIARGLVLAGSALTPLNCFQNAVQLFGKSLAVASRLCSANPARLLGLNAGEVALGRNADLVMLDADLNLKTTIVAGRGVFGVYE